jgi:YHS domain-containing protein
MNERCPVCGADVDRDDPPATSYFDDDLYSFCCDRCKEEFDQNPERFVTSSATALRDAA